ncbi:class I adenylate-forming enzyme family protein [Pseudoalteromonas piscicida]|uniref:class I adenylate-forming enzyme family protein n=1 Tax=Pseudoalteromonas piscicida TaxID=43662 RepID=UPI0030A777DF
MNIASLLVRSGSCYANLAAVAKGSDTLLDYASLAARAAVMANNLINKHGLRQGDKVAIIAANCPEYVELYFAIWHAGLVVVPVNAKLHQSEFEYVLQNSEAKLCFCSDKLAPTLRAIHGNVEGLQQIITIASDAYLSLYQGEGMAMVDTASDQPAWLFYTSGTTGRPKGAMQSHRNLLTMTQCYFSDVDDIFPGDGVLHAAPMSHGGGYYILPHIAKGGVNVVPQSSGFNEPEMLALIATHQGVSFFAAPTMVKRLVEYGEGQAQRGEPADFSKLKTIIYGGGPMYQADLHKAQQLLGDKLVQIYGQGECPMTITSLNRYAHGDTCHPDYHARLASVGTAMTGIEIKIVDSNGQAVPCNESGEIWVRGDAVMLGYYNNPTATAETIVDGWLRTGDMAKQGKDGFITLVDRSKDVIISGGTNIYPREIEEVLNRHPHIVESSVIGCKDPQWGEVVVAVVVKQPGHALDAASLDTYCLENMARFKRPKHYYFVDQLPKNNTGKILKTQLRQQFGDALVTAQREPLC